MLLQTWNMLEFVADRPDLSCSILNPETDSNNFSYLILISRGLARGRLCEGTSDSTYCDPCVIPEM
jgi:hypothetical protein